LQISENSQNSKQVGFILYYYGWYITYLSTCAVCKHSGYNYSPVTGSIQHNFSQIKLQLSFITRK